MRCLFILILALTVLVAAFGCDEYAVEPVKPKVDLDQFVQFDTSQFYVLKSNYGLEQEYSEIYLWWEQNFGEPFTDVNENGVYDPGVDIFIICADCDSNQDLNNDGRYNGPDEPWESGFPFDDIDGDGVCRQESYYSSLTGEAPVPYFDANKNNRYDDTVAYQSYFVRPILNEETYNTTYWRYVSSDTTLTYTSDSGVVYYPDLMSTGCPVCTQTIPYGEFILSDTSLFFNHIYLTSQLIIEIFPADTIISDTNQVFLGGGADGPRFVRRITLDQNLQIDDIVYEGLVKVWCGQFEALGAWQETYTGSFWEFYFSQPSGLLAIHQKPLASSHEQWYYFQPLDVPLPVTMTK
ncbi:MAG: hypothetical protein AB1483_05840 [Candidatus Zixiibacteriota bacterium]